MKRKKIKQAVEIDQRNMTKNVSQISYACNVSSNVEKTFFKQCVSLTIEIFLFSK